MLCIPLHRTLHTKAVGRYSTPFWMTTRRKESGKPRTRMRYCIFCRSVSDFACVTRRSAHRMRYVLVFGGEGKLGSWTSAIEAVQFAYRFFTNLGREEKFGCCLVAPDCEAAREGDISTFLDAIATHHDMWQGDAPLLRDLLSAGLTVHLFSGETYF